MTRVLSGLLGVAALCAALGAGPAAAQPKAAAAELGFTVKHQSMVDALLLVRPVLSPTGTVEARGKRLVVRDVPAVTQRLGEMLADFDHPRVALRVVVQIVQAYRENSGSPETSTVPEPLLSRLRQTLRYWTYRLVSQVGFEASEGTAVDSSVGPDYNLSFRLGTLRQRGQMVWLHNFALAQQSSLDQLLLDTNLVLSLDRPLAVGFTQDESSRTALLMVLTCTRAEPKP